MKQFYLFLLSIISIGYYQNLLAQGTTFSENIGQWDPKIKFKAAIQDGALMITDEGLVYNFASSKALSASHDAYIADPNYDMGKDNIPFHAYKFSFINPKTEGYQTKELQTYYENYFLGQDPKGWKSNVKHFKRIIQKNTFPNIDASYYVQENQLKYDFIVKPEAQPENIQLKLEGATAAINHKGQLVINTSVNQVIEDKPFAYQLIQNDTIEIHCDYAFHNNILSFKLGKYDAKHTLIIDPSLIFASYSGATSSNHYSHTSTFDLQGNTIIGALSFGIGWPPHLGAYNSTFAGQTDVGILKLNSTGTTKIFSSYLGGQLGENPYSMTTDDEGNIFVSGNTQSSNFPTTTGAYQSTFNGPPTDLFIAKISADGSNLLASTYFGSSGADAANTPGSLANYNSSPLISRYNHLDSSIWITSSTQGVNFPTTANALQTTPSGSVTFLLQLSNNLNQLLYSTFFPANEELHFSDLKFSNSNKLYLAGVSKATNLGTNGALHSNFLGGTSDAIILKFNTQAKTIEACTYLGTAGPDRGLKLAIFPENNNIYLSGYCGSANYPITPNAFHEPNSLNFIQLTDSNLSTNIAAADYGGASYMFTSDAFVDTCTAIALAGMVTGTAPLPLTADAYMTTGEFWMGNFTQNLGSLVYGTRFGYGGHTHTGTFHFDNDGNIHHSVCDAGGNFLCPSNVWSPTKQTPGFDMVSFKFDISSSNNTFHFHLDTFNTNDTGCAPHTISMVNESYNFDTYVWDFGNGDVDTSYQASYTFAQAGSYWVKLQAADSSCGVFREDSVLIFVKPVIHVSPFVHDTVICSNTPYLPLTVDSVVPAIATQHYQVNWGPSNAIMNTSGLTALVDHSASHQISLHFEGLALDSFCLTDTTVFINIDYFDSTHLGLSPMAAQVCQGDTFEIQAWGGENYIWQTSEFLSPLGQQTFSAKPLHSIIYSVRMTDSLGCDYDYHCPVSVLDRDEAEGGPDLTIKRGKAVQLQSHTDAVNFHWEYEGQTDFINIPRPIVQPQKSTLYHLITNNSSGCKNHDSVWVYVEDLKAPNAFTPNGDGLNDAFNPVPSGPRVVVKYFAVYNRYGQRVFYTNQTGKGWDGTFNQTICDIGVYFFQVEYQIGQELYRDQGDVSLLK